ncbi:chemotaxis protein CheA [Thalassolituus alkanivorans]|uniref:chemotaxis protein CheA n=1 Tax=Thalassolituus alkanivorans TaxID=2881055 RepID=UPI000C49F814|nr:chemotaxis protein CheA [Thalassolituus alkanivorans]MAY14440.1 chemotaxis protein CheA [Oceanospirillaceae bacterium]MCB2385290.1 chemotaxis protein CheA [Thalassolituus alkanivorans]MCB2421853.1 chemotaxis protein CheA [Thalassolituus alkanivorans]
MSIDLSQFHQIFFEESFEGLDVMESQLLDLQPQEVDAESVNTIFRAAHSIKGGAGTFGFMQVSEFTHVVETLLDEIRSGTRSMQRNYIDLFLQSVDCLRAMLGSLQSGSEPDGERAATLKASFEKILQQSADSDSQVTEEKPTVADEGCSNGWRITFRPAEDILQTGNEPFRMFRELQELVGADNLTVIPLTDNLPEFTSLHPENCYLSWVLEVRSDVNRDDIAAVFEWVADDCDIDYQPLSVAAAPDIPTADTAVTEMAESAVSTDSTEPVSAVIPDKVSEALSASAAQQAKPAARTAGKSNEPSSIRVSIDKVDSLINMVGELVITQSMLGQLGQDFDMSRLARLQEGLTQLEQNTRELQESVMKIRMMPISFAFSRFPRLVRDLGGQLGKQVNLVMLGENTELDKTVMEKIGDPLVHLVRNSLDHGLETTEQRLAAGKPGEGTITLNAYHQGGNIVIEVKDDGAGLNEERILNKARQKGLVPETQELSSEEIHQLIFLPGFSTADVVSDISGRGVGMDVVRRNIAELNGSIEVKSKRGKGSTFIIRLPLTLAILDGQLVKVKDETYIFPLVSIVESIQLQKRSLNHVTGSQYVMKLRDEYIPIVRLDELFNLRASDDEFENPMLVVVEGDNEKVGIVVDDLLGQQQVVIKSLEQNYKRVTGISGATILGDGTVALIIDVSDVGKNLDKSAKGQSRSDQAA